MSEHPSVYNMIVRTARKDHKCCECSGVIQKGEQYNYHSGVWDGEGASFKVCFDCDALRAYMDSDVRYEEERTAFGNIRYDMGNFDDPEYLAARFAAIRAKRSATDTDHTATDELERTA